MDANLLRSAEEIARVGLTAWASKELVGKLLGPSAEYLGGEAANLIRKCNINVATIFQKAARKLGTRLDEPGQVPPRILKGVVEEGAFVEDPLVAEYLAGVLAASRTSNPKDDIGLGMLATLKQLSTYDLRLHYLFYRSFRSLYAGSDLFISDRASSAQMLVFLPLRWYRSVMNFSPSEDAPAILGHSSGAIQRAGLANDGATGPPEYLQQFFLGVKESGFVGQVCTFGAELFLWAHGMRDLRIQVLLDKSVAWTDVWDVPSLADVRRVSNDGPVAFGRK